jgi:glucose-1-phosphate adenylyltransferase
VHPVFNLYNYDWPIYTTYDPLPPAKFVHAEAAGWATPSTRSSPRGRAVRLVRRELGAVAEGHRQLVGEGQRLVLMDNVKIGRHAVVHNAILDKGVVVPENCRIGVDPEHDRARGFTVSPNGIVVIGKGQHVEG